MSPSRAAGSCVTVRAFQSASASIRREIALETTEDPAAAKALFRGFTSTALSEPSPPLWSYLLLETHPTVEQRIEMAEAWAARPR